MDYRRVYREGGTFFFTVVTFERARFLCTERARKVLREAIEECRERWPFDMNAIVLLPDHLHAIWTLPEGDADYSTRWGWIKKTFTQRWVAGGGFEGVVSDGKIRDGRRGVWQAKFWEHTIRDQDDLNRHQDYIYYNPVKHGEARCPHEWEWSSFHRWVEKGGYARDWQCVCGGMAAERLDFSGLPVERME